MAELPFARDFEMPWCSCDINEQLNGVKHRNHYDDNLVVTGCTRDCHRDNWKDISDNHIFTMITFMYLCSAITLAILWLLSVNQCPNSHNFHINVDLIFIDWRNSMGFLFIILTTNPLKKLHSNSWHTSTQASKFNPDLFILKAERKHFSLASIHKDASNRLRSTEVLIKKDFRINTEAGQLQASMEKVGPRHNPEYWWN